MVLSTQSCTKNLEAPIGVLSSTIKCMGQLPAIKKFRMVTTPRSRVPLRQLNIAPPPPDITLLTLNQRPDAVLGHRLPKPNETIKQHQDRSGYFPFLNQTERDQINNMEVVSPSRGQALEIVGRKKLPPHTHPG
jgi:hypothetical protein